VRRTLLAPSRGSDREAAVLAAASCAPAELSEPASPCLPWQVEYSRHASATPVSPRSSSLPLSFSYRRGRPAAVSEIWPGTIEQSTRTDGMTISNRPLSSEGPVVQTGSQVARGQPGDLIQGNRVTEVPQGSGPAGAQGTRRDLSETPHNGIFSNTEST